MFGRILAIASALMGGSKTQSQAEYIPVVTSPEEHDRCYERAGDLVTPYLRLSNTTPKLWNTAQAQHDLRRGIALYTAVVNYAPSNWNAHWLMGKAYQALREPTNAYDAFAKSYALQKENADVAREYMFECLELGRCQEAVLAAEHAVALMPRDAGLLANLALAYTIAGRSSEALVTVDQSLSIDPADEVTLNLKRVVQEISDGKRPEPKKLGDISSE